MLRIYDVVIEVVAGLNPMVEVLERKDPDLANQCKRARASMPLNLREGSHGRGKSRANRYSFVAGSADELIAIHDTGVACGYFAAMPELVEKLRQIIGTMRKCMR
ncbi:MAG: four helix bundle protein [Deltaproteobacteria bacterium]|nr:four helix bundle protein [Deltaproteobacteria bacterium]